MKFSELVISALGDSSIVSFGRVASAVSLIFCLGWDSCYVWFAMRHMDFTRMTISDVLPPAGALLAQAGFCTTFYGINKLKAGFDARSSPENGQK